MYYERYNESASYICARIKDPIPETAIILGEELSEIVEKMDDKKRILYKEVPHFPTSTINNKGELVYGHINYSPVLVMNGLIHYYEGYSMEELTFPIRVLKKMGVKNIIFTGAVNAINFNYLPGDFIIINDHINLEGVSPLRGKNFEEFGERCPRMTNAYDREMINLIYDIAREIALPINEGIYAYQQGPNYETSAEANMLRTMGADVVGMSIVPEVIIAKHCGLKIGAIAYVTNMASGVSNRNLSVEEVEENKQKINEQFYMVIQKLVASLYIKTGSNTLRLGEGNE